MQTKNVKILTFDLQGTTLQHVQAIQQNPPYDMLFMSSQRSFMQKKRKKVIEQFLRKFTLKFFPFDPMLIFRPPKFPVTVIESHYISF